MPMMGMIAGQQLNTLKGEIADTTSQVNWEDFNYPRILKIIHYNPEEDIKNEANRKWSKFLEYSFLSMVGFFAINFLINILGMIFAYSSFGFMRVMYTLFHVFLFSPIAMFCFYKGHRCMSGMDDMTLYKISEIV